MILFIGIVYLILIITFPIITGGLMFFLFDNNPIYFIFSVIVYLICIITVFVINSMTNNLLLKLAVNIIKQNIITLIANCKLKTIQFVVNKITRR